MVNCRLKRNRNKATCRVKIRRTVKYGKWFRGNIYAMSSDQIAKSKKYSKGVKKPTALETKKIKGRTYSRYYYKPLKPGEFWD